MKQINELQERIDNLKSQKVVSKMDEFLIKNWERSITLLQSKQ